MELEIKEPETDEEFSEYYRLRYETLRAPQGEEPGSERDDPLEAQSNHLIAKVGDRVVGAYAWAVLTKGSASNPELYVQGRQCAVDPEFQRHGVGVALLQDVERRARDLGAVEYMGYVRVEAVPWVTSHYGYQVLGKGPKLGDIEHMVMGIKLR